MLAWKVAGYYGLDRFVLPALGTPWQWGSLIAPKQVVKEGVPQINTA
jgi:thiosulfate dehydrogenase (quinone) large subunit